jgi:hypothetical protein
VRPDPEKLPTVQHEPVEISRFFGDIGSNSRVVILRVLFSYVKGIVLDVVDMVLCIE